MSFEIRGEITDVETFAIGKKLYAVVEDSDAEANDSEIQRALRVAS